MRSSGRLRPGSTSWITRRCKRRRSRMADQRLMMQILSRLEAFQKSMVAWEQKIMFTWNTLNVFTRLIEQIGIKEGWWKDREEFTKTNVEIMGTLLSEHKANELKQRQRVQKDQAEGHAPEPMAPVQEPATPIV